MSLNTDLKYWLAFSQFPKIGSTRFLRLFNYFPKMEEAWRASSFDLAKAGLEENIIQEFFAKKQEIDPDQELEKLKKENIQVVTIGDENYPRLLKEIWNPPALLYFRGVLEKDEKFSVAVVGTRKISNYGKQITPEITRELSANEITIVSGMALGVDTIAHETALEAGGKTIAVLGSGIDTASLYPTQNRYLSSKIIASGGTVVSEYPIGTVAMPQYFPHRNRIISGLSLGTLVVEAAEESGALITARYALEQNREVFAVPGSIYNPVSVGPNNLIKMGAKTVTSANDILETLNLIQTANFIQTRKIIPESPEEEKLLEFLSSEPIHIDKLISLSGLDTQKANSTLTIMEMKGKVKNLGGMNYVINK